MSKSQRPVNGRRLQSRHDLGRALAVSRLQRKEGKYPLGSDDLRDWEEEIR